MEQEALFPLVLSVLARSGRQEIRERFGLQSCIVSTRIVIDVLNRYGIMGRPFAVRTIASYGDYAVVLGSVDGTPGKPATWNGGVAGHLVTVVPGKNLLIDASIDQLDFARFGIGALPCPFVAEVSDAFIDGIASAYFSVEGCALVYQPHSLPPAVVKTREWKSKTPSGSVVARICAEIENARPLTSKEFRSRFPDAYAYCGKRERSNS